MSQDAGLRPDETPYEAIGGAQALRRLVDRFYDIMEKEPAAAPLRNMHAADLAPMRRRLFEFMSGWLGGPRLYSGCVVGGHAHLKIGERERDQWLLCMRRAMAEQHIAEPVAGLIDSALARMAGMFVNEADGGKMHG